MPARLKLGAQVLAVAVVAGLLALLVWKLAHGSGKTAEPQNFTLDRLNGPGSVELASLRGKVVVLNFWASWCGPCRQEAPAIESFWRRYRGKGVVVVGVNTADAASDARRFVARYRLTYPIVRSTGKTLWGPYGIAALPETRIIDRDGKYAGTQFYGPVTAAELTSGVQRALRAA